MALMVCMAAVGVQLVQHDVPCVCVCACMHAPYVKFDYDHLDHLDHLDHCYRCYDHY